MKIVIVVDETRPLELGHAQARASRLRRSGFGVVGLTRKLSSRQREQADVLHAVGAGGWRSARRLARRLGRPLVYDHPPGGQPPRRVDLADAVISSGPTDATMLGRLLGSGRRPGLIPPELYPSGGGVQPRLRQRLGVGGRTLALQEAGAISSERAGTLIQAISHVPTLDLVFIGGDRRRWRSSLVETAGVLGVADRVHFVNDVPAVRRADYLAEADVGLALGAEGGAGGRLPSADLFEILGVPFVVSTGVLAWKPQGGIVAAVDPQALCEAIVHASEHSSLPAREDGAEILEEMIVELAAPQSYGGTAASSWASKGGNGGGQAADEATAGDLLRRAKALHGRGDLDAAIRLYSQIAGDSHPPDEMAAAAASLARLGVRGEARRAIECVTTAKRRPPLATARVGEAAAVLGELDEARSFIDEVLNDPAPAEPALRTATRVLEQVGEPRAALRVARQIGDETAVARIEGALESYDPTWLPARGGDGTRVSRRVNRSITLLETSLPHVRSGYTYRAQTLLRAQRQAGIEPAVLTRLGFPVTRGVDAPPVERVDGIVHHRASLPGVRQYTSVPVSEQLRQNARWATTIGREIRPAGIVATTPHLNGLVGLALREELGVPVIYDVRGFPEMTWAVRNGGHETDVFDLRRIAETRCMREADLVTTLSETMRGQIIERGVPPENVFVLPHAVDTEKFAPVQPDRRLAARLGLTDRTVVGYISSLVAYEGVETLIEAIALARQADPSVAGLIVGDGELLPSLEAQATELGLDGHVVFTGRVDAHDIAGYYPLVDVFVCPRNDHEVTRYVTPLKPFEAMAAGCCVVASDLSTLREAVRSGECGELFPAGDSGALATTILGLIEEPERRELLGRAAREHIVANHSFDILCSRVELAWEELLSR